MLLKRQYLLIATLVSTAVAGSFWLIPNAQELALMQMKDKHFDAARSAYEKELAASALNLEVANNLSDLYIQKGDIKKAIGIMEKYVSSNPNDLQARIKLGRLYQYDQRTDEYMRNLEAINKLRPSADNLNTLSDIYNFKGDYDKQEKTLKDLIAYEKGKDPKNFYDLANIQASRHDYTGAISTLRDLQKSDPEHFTFSNEVLMVSLMLDNKQPDDALKAASEWLDKHDNAEEAYELINMVHYKGSVAMGKSLISRYSDDKIDSSPKLLEASVLLKLSDNQDDEVYKHLRDLYQAKRLPLSLDGDLLQLTVERGDQKMTHELMKNIPLNTLPEDQVLRLIESSITQEDSALLAYITETFRGEDARKLYPVIAAALAVANQASDAPVLLSRLDTLGFSHEQTLEIASICAHFNRSECATHLLGNLPEADQLSDTEIATIGDIYLLLREPEKGYAYVHEAMEKRNSPVLEIVMVRFAAARGKDHEVQEWLGANTDKATPHVLTDMFFAAYDNGRYDTAVRIAQYFREKYKSDIGRSLLASAYVENKQYELAVKVLRENSNKPRSEEDEDNYLSALAKLAPKHRGYRDELVAHATARLNSSGLPEKQRMDILHTLIDINETDAAMPYFKAEALASGGEWTTLYAELLDKKGRHDEALTFWLKAFRDPATTPAQKEDIAYVLLDHGDKSDAEPIFLDIAAAADSKSAAVSELLYIWGPKPSTAHMQWLEKRYSESTDSSEKRRWAAIIGDAGSAEYIEGFVTRHPETINTPEVADTYFDALADEGKLAGRSDYYAKSGNTLLLSKYASVAQDAGLTKDARDAYEALLRLEPSNYVAMREFGMAAFEQADYSTAKKYLGQYITQYNAGAVRDPKAYLAYFHYGEILRKDDDKVSAEPFYRRTLALMGDAKTPEDIAVKGQSQVWAGDKEAGLKTLAAATQQYPQNSDLHSAFADTLMELGDYDKARELLQSSPKQAAKKNKYLTSADLPSLSTPIKDYTVYRHNHELLITFSRPVILSDINKLRNLPWVSYTSDGYDTVLVATLPEYKFHINSNKLHLTENEVTNDVPEENTTTNLAGTSK